MSRLLGIDLTRTVARVAAVRTSYRKITLESFGEALVAPAGSEVEALRLALGASSRPDAVATALSGERTFYRRLELPAAAQKEIDNVLAFELESTIPFEMDDAVFDYRMLRKEVVGATADGSLPLFAVLARTDDVRERITPIREALGVEPERVGTGPLPLANLAAVIPELERPASEGPIAIVDVGETVSEVLVLQGGEPVFARTLSRGTIGLPDSAPALARELRQTQAAFRTLGGDPLTKVYLTGIGSTAAGAELFLATELGLSILPLPRPQIEGMTDEQAAQFPRFAKALGLALGLAGRAKGLNLRRGALEAERSYPYLREKFPLLAGLASVIAVSFGFSVLAELRTLDAEKELLNARLAVASRDVLGEETTDPDRVKELLGTDSSKADEDPLPHVDGFDAMVALSRAVPKDVVHDVVELDVARGHVSIQGTVPTVGDAETIAKNLKDNRCFKDVKIARTSQFTEGKQKYVLEFDLKCEEKKKPASGAKPEGTAQPADSAKPDKEGGR
ncbi:MAG: pilus assembly protein PilM [Byssovorax sp.]